MQRFIRWFSVLVVAGGLVVMACRPKEAATVAPWIGTAVSFWLGGSHERPGTGGGVGSAGGGASPGERPAAEEG